MVLIKLVLVFYLKSLQNKLVGGMYTGLSTVRNSSKLPPGGARKFFFLQYLNIQHVQSILTFHSFSYSSCRDIEYKKEG